MAAPWFAHTLDSPSNEDEERLMLNTTPESVAAHQRDLAAMAPTPGAAEAIAQRRGRRRQKLSRFVATIYRATPFTNMARESEQAPSEQKPAT